MSLSKPPIVFWIIAVIAVLWNIMGVAAFASDILITPEALESMEPAMREMYENNPQWM